MLGRTARDSVSMAQVNNESVLEVILVSIGSQSSNSST